MLNLNLSENPDVVTLNKNADFAGHIIGEYVLMLPDEEKLNYLKTVGATHLEAIKNDKEAFNAYADALAAVMTGTFSEAIKPALPTDD